MNKLLKITFITMVLITIMQISVFASTLTLKVTADKEGYELNDKVVVTVDWTEKMQAASFTIKYDSDKLEFESANIANTFYNTEKTGEISVNWASMDEVDCTKMTFEFKTIKTGEANIFIKEVDAFADGNLVSPTSYDYATSGNINITINTKDGNQENNKEDESQLNKKEDNTVASGIMPNTGIKKIIVPVIISLTIFGGIGFIKYKRLAGI